MSLTAFLFATTVIRALFTYSLSAHGLAVPPTMSLVTSLRLLPTTDDSILEEERT